MSFMDRLRAFAHPTAGEQALMAKINAERMLWTSKGHLFVADLENKPQWIIEEGGKAVTFIDEWVTKEGESVSRAVHHLDTKPLVAETTAGNINGGPVAAIPVPATGEAS